MTDAERKECHAIIHTASVGAGAIGGGTFISCADAIPIKPQSMYTEYFIYVSFP